MILIKIDRIHFKCLESGKKYKFNFLAELRLIGCGRCKEKCYKRS